MIERKELILNSIEGIDKELKITLEPLVDEIIFLENHLTELKKMTLIRVHPKNKDISETTPAGKQYKEYLQQYINCMKLILSYIGKDNIEENNPLLSFLSSRKKL